MQLKISDSFINPDCSGDFEWTANMVNLNDGKNDDLLNNCRPLKDYMTLINEIRKNCKTMEFESAVDAAVTYCIEHDVLKTFLLKHRAEVKDVCITEYNEKSFVDGIRAEGRAEGQNEKGLAVYRNLRKRGFSKEDALVIADISPDLVVDED